MQLPYSNRLRFVSQKLKSPKLIGWIALGALAIVGLFIIGNSILLATKPASSKTTIANAKASAQINKDFTFPVVDGRGKEITKLKYTLGEAELRDEIIVQGKRALAVQGRTFLIVTLKIANTYDKGFDINSRDYMRLTINGKLDEQIAPEIHNDPVQIQPISTKTTRIGFAVNDTDKDFVLVVGEIKGPKEDLALQFK